MSFAAARSVWASAAAAGCCACAGDDDEGAKGLADGDADHAHRHRHFFFFPNFSRLRPRYRSLSPFLFFFCVPAASAERHLPIGADGKRKEYLKLTNLNCPRMPTSSKISLSLSPAVAAAASAASSSSTSVSISVTHQVPFGSHLRAVGEHPALGAWDPNAAPALEWSQGDNWRCELSDFSTASGGSERLDFKLVVVHGDGELVRFLSLRSF